jgi:FkbM family methyltransferase
VRLEDLRDWWTLRRLAENPWETVRFRETRRPGQVLEVRLRARPPLHLRADASDFHVFHRIFLRDEYRLARLPARLGCVLDIGANVGLFAARIAPRAGRVVCYEPVPENFAVLRQNLAAWPSVTAHCEAVAAASGKLRIFRPASAALSGRHSACADASAHLSEGWDEARARSLDEVFARDGIETCDLLKIDVEGSEYAILHAASETTWARIARIHGEYHDVAPDDPRTRVEAFAAFLRARGYTVELAPHRRKPNLGLFFATRSGAA